MNREFTRPTLIYLILCGCLVLGPAGPVASSQREKSLFKRQGTPEEIKAAQKLLILPENETGWVRLPLRIIIAPGS